MPTLVKNRNCAYATLIQSVTNCVFLICLQTVDISDVSELASTARQAEETEGDFL